jgi:BirA family biotin operon repressor/biotin-[acetyl-CoA-carboxylase] ligase
MLGPVEIVDEVDSTNRVLVERARAGAPHGSVLVARHQTAGRGRRDRRWDAPPGASLLVSVLVRPQLPVDDLHLVTFAAGLAALDACSAEGLPGASLKWPNDVVIDVEGEAQKLAGLLAESVLERGAPTALVVGMRLNVNWGEPPPAGGAALNRLLGRPVASDELLGRWLAAFEDRYARLGTASGRSLVRDEYRAACSTIGRLVRIETTNGAVEGVPANVDDAGHLVLQDGRSYAVGDVVHLRPVSPA